MLSSSSSGSVVGRRLGPYVLRKLIAEGGMGTVYDAYHERLEREVALKTLRMDQEQSEEDLQRFLNEARAAARLNHPNVVSVFDVGEHKNVRYLAMELVRGRSLYERIKNEGVLDPSEAAEIVAKACDGLQHAHDLGILHRDLKPANVLLQAPQGLPRLTDFGVARAPGNQRLTKTGIALGTPNYMSPEQAMGLNSELDGRSDVWAMGAVLYECVTGFPPFNLPSQLETMQAVVSDPVVPPSQHRGEVDADLDAIVLRCLQKERDGRYPAASELAADLRRYAAGEPVRARPRGALEQARDGLREHVLLGAIAAAVAVATLMLAFLGGVVLGIRRGGSEGGGALAWRSAALAEAEASLASAELSPDQLRALRATLLPAALRERAAVELEPSEELEQALAPEACQAATRSLRARIAFRLGEEGRANEPEALGECVEAARLDPRGPSGRAARLAVARGLAARGGAEALELARDALACLRGEDELGRAAALLEAELLPPAQWAAAGALAERAQQGELTPDERERAALLRALGGAFGASVSLPPGEVSFLRSKEGPRIVSLEGDTLLRVTTAAGEEVKRLRVGAPLAFVRAGDTNGDGEGELVMLVEGKRNRVGIVAIGLGETSAHSRFSAKLPIPSAFALGQLDGSGGEELVALNDDARASAVVWSGKPVRLVEESERGPRLEGLAIADLDGDGKEEVLCGSGRAGEGDLRVFGLEGGAMTERARLPLGRVRWMRAARLVRAAGALVACEGVGGLELAVVGAGEAGPAVLARWPLPPGEELVGDLRGAVLDLGAAGTWLARAWTSRQGWRLQVAPLGELLAGAPRVVLDQRAGSPPPGYPRFQSCQIDGDPESELVIGDLLLGVGEAGSQALPPAPALLRAPDARLDERAARERAALGLPPAAIAAPFAALADARLRAARLLDERARRAYSLGEVAAGRRAGEAAREEARSVLTEARGALEGSGDAFELLTLGALAADLAEDPAAVEELLARARQAARSLGELAALRSLEEELGGRASAEGVVCDMTQPSTHALFGMTQALDGRMDVQGLTLYASGRATQCVLTPLVTTQVDALAPPLQLEAQLTLLGHAQDCRVLVGALPSFSGPVATGSGPLGPSLTFYERGTGVELWLYDPGGERRAMARILVEGRPLGGLHPLPSLRAQLRLSLVLRPIGGELVGDLRVRDAEGRELLRVRERARRALPSELSYLGIVCPGGGSSVESRSWARETQVRLERLEFGLGRRVSVGSGPPPNYVPQSCFARGDDAGAIAAARPGNGTTGVSHLMVRALARGRSGDVAGGLSDLRSMAQRSPMHLGLFLGQNATQLQRDPRDRELIARFLLQLRDAQQAPALATLARQLLGDLSAYVAPDDSPTSSGKILAAYLSFRRIGVSDQERWQHWQRYGASFQQDNLPWTALPNVLPAAPGQLEDARAAKLWDKAPEGTSVGERWVRYQRAHAARPRRPEPLLRLAELSEELELYGMAEDYYLQALDLARAAPLRQEILIATAR